MRIDSPEEFERQIALLEHLLKESGAKVKWNERIPDPDNPKQGRQIDITIRRRKKLTLVECRLHSRPQDVKWIEELYGRRASLNADSIIAVSTSSFTEGALKKAARLGVITRDFRALTKTEIEKWGVFNKVTAIYTQFFQSTIYIVEEYPRIDKIVNPKEMFRTDDGENWPVKYVFRRAADLVKNSDQDNMRLQLFAKRLHIGGAPVREVILKSNFRTLRISTSLPIVYTYGNAGDGLQRDAVTIEGEKTSDFVIIRGRGLATPIVDVSIAPSVDNAIMHAIEFSFGRPENIREVGLVGMDKRRVDMFRFKTTFIQRDTPLYKNLLMPGEPGTITLPGVSLVETGECVRLRPIWRESI